MADAPKLADWALRHTDRLRLEVSRVGWTDEWIPGYSDYEVRVSLRDGVHVGRGLAREDQLAFSKAVAEALERAAASLLEEPCRVGTAAHVDFPRAAWNSYCELLSLDRALCHHLCRSRLQPLSLKLVADDIPLRPLREQLDAHGLILELARARPAADAEVCMAVVRRRSPDASCPGFVCGFGCDSGLPAAAAHAVLECMREGCAVLVGGARPSLPLEELERTRNPQWHFWMTQTQPALAYLQEHLCPDGKEGAAPVAESVRFSDVACQQVSTLDGVLPDLPVCIVRAQSDRLMPPLFGRELSAAALRRAERFGGKPVSTDGMPPHFYG